MSTEPTRERTRDAGDKDITFVAPAPIPMQMGVGPVTSPQPVVPPQPVVNHFNIVNNNINSVGDDANREKTACGKCKYGCGQLCEGVSMCCKEIAAIIYLQWECCGKGCKHQGTCCDLSKDDCNVCCREAGCICCCYKEK